MRVVYATVTRAHTAEARVAHAAAQSASRLEQQEVVHSSGLQSVRSRHASHSAAENQHRRALWNEAFAFLLVILLHFNQIQFSKYEYMCCMVMSWWPKKANTNFQQIHTDGRSLQLAVDFGGGIGACDTWILLGLWVHCHIRVRVFFLVIWVSCSTFGVLVGE